MGDSASRPNGRPSRTRSGGAARPPATPTHRRSKSSAPVRQKTPRARNACSGRSRSKISPPSVNDDEESPTKRQKYASSTLKPVPDGTARNLLDDMQGKDDVIDFPSEPPSFEQLLKQSWFDLHRLDFASEIGDDHLCDGDLNDEVCLICREPASELTFCIRCVHAICPSCSEIDTVCRMRWQCSVSGLRCTNRRQIRTYDDKSKEDETRSKSKKSLRLKPGQFIEVMSSMTPAYIKSQAWTPGYDSDAERTDYERDRVYFAKIIDVGKTDVQVEFLIYPDRTSITTLRENELLLTTTKYDVKRWGILGRASKPIVTPWDSEAPKGDHYLVRSRYDLDRRILRPLLADGAADPSPSDVVIDTRPQQEDTNLSLIEKAVQSLQLSSAPDALPCRDKERAEIERILVAQLRVGGGGGGGLYISGLPGTGKTATVRRVVRGLQLKSGLPKFKYVEINALKLQAPRFAYAKLWKAISGEHCSPAKALVNLQTYYNKPRVRKQIIILVLDEFDYLVESRTHNVIYNLFTFPTTRKSGLIVVGIANTLDLPERIGGRVFSRLGLQCMNFEPYTSQQIEQILLERLKGLQNFADPTAITFCAKSVASTSGDLRRALEIISTAVELCSSDGGKLTLNHVALAKNQFSDTPAIQYIRGAAVLELALLCAFLQELKQTERHEADYDAVVRRMARILKNRGKEIVPSTVADRVIHELSDKSLISLCPKRDIARPSLRLYTNIEDVKFALQKTSFSDINL